MTVAKRPTVKTAAAHGDSTISARAGYADIGSSRFGSKTLAARPEETVRKSKTIHMPTETSTPEPGNSGIPRGEDPLVEGRLDDGLEGDEVPDEHGLPAQTAVPAAVAVGKGRPQAAEPARVGQGSGKQDEEPAVHQDELENVGSNHRPKAGKADVDGRKRGSEEDGDRGRPAGHLFEKHGEHQEIGDGNVEAKTAAAPVSAALRP